MKKEVADKILKDIRQGYNTIADSFGCSREKLYWDELKRFVDYVREGEAVLDVGCGNARTFALFKGKGIHYAGVDVSEKLIEQAKERLKGEDARFKVGDILDLPVPDGRYDAVLAVAVVHHIPSFSYRVQAVQELARAARPGGYVMTTSWNLWQPRYWKVQLHQLFGFRNGWDFGDLKITWKKPHFPRFYHTFTKKEMQKLCAAAGLEIVEQYYVKKGEITHWLRGENLVTIARRPQQ